MNRLQSTPYMQGAGANTLATPNKISWPRIRRAAAVVAVSALAIAGCSNDDTSASPSSSPKINLHPAITAPSSPSAIDTAAIAQCRFDAVTEYMDAVGFESDEYVIGEDRMDWTTEEANTAGSASFGSIRSRQELAQTFTSSTPEDTAITNRQLDKFMPEYSEEEILDPMAWEFVQPKVESKIPGNTGFIDGHVVEAGVRSSGAFDPNILFVDLETCEVAVSTNLDYYPEGTEVDENGVPIVDADEKVVGLIRSACANPGDGLKPKNPRQSTAVNTDVDDQLKDGGEKHTVNYNNGAEDPIGLQTDPKKDAEEAKKKAEQENKADKEKHQKEKKEDTKADDNQENGTVEGPSSSW